MLMRLSLILDDAVYYFLTDLDTANMRDDSLLEQTTRYMIAAFLKQSNMSTQALNGEHNSVLSEVYR